MAIKAGYVYAVVDTGTTLVKIGRTQNVEQRRQQLQTATPHRLEVLYAVHFRRVALTRAKARVLRDALGIDLVAVEELAEE